MLVVILVEMVTMHQMGLFTGDEGGDCEDEGDGDDGDDGGGFP